MPQPPFAGAIPDDRLYCCATNTWIYVSEQQLTLGITRFGLHLSGELIAFTAKPAGAEIARGRGLGTIECHKTVLAVHSPLSLRLITGNEDAETRPALINTYPYERGWMVRGLALDWESEKRLLCDAGEYKRHIRSIDPEARFED